MDNSCEVKGYIINSENRKPYMQLSYYWDDIRMKPTRTLPKGISNVKAKRMLKQWIEEKEAELRQLMNPVIKHPLISCYDKWVEIYASKKETEATTADTYRHQSLVAKDYFGNRKKEVYIEDLTSDDITDFYNWALDYGRRRKTKAGNTGLSRRTVMDVAALLRRFLEEAVNQGVIEKNPAYKIDVPERKNRIEEDDRGFLTKGEARAFLLFLKNDPKRFRQIYEICYVALQLALRRSEILGLRFKNVNYQKKVIRIRDTVTRTTKGIHEKGHGKSKAAMRSIHVSDEIIELIRGIRYEQVRKGYYKGEEGYVFIRPDGKNWDPDRVSKLVKAAIEKCKSLGLIDKEAKVTMHQLRDTIATMMFEKKIQIEVIAKYLGHSQKDVETLREHYLHITQRYLEQETGQFEDVFSDREDEFEKIITLNIK